MVYELTCTDHDLPLEKDTDPLTGSKMLLAQRKDKLILKFAGYNGKLLMSGQWRI